MWSQWRPILDLSNDAQGPHLQDAQDCTRYSGMQRSKEARPEDFVKNKDRYYMTKVQKEVIEMQRLNSGTKVKGGGGETLTFRGTLIEY